MSASTPASSMGGLRCSGSWVGRSWPASLMSMRYMARQNSEWLRSPSLSVSARLQILDKTELGSFDSIITALALPPVNFPSSGWAAENCSVHLKNENDTRILS